MQFDETVQSYHHKLHFFPFSYCVWTCNDGLFFFQNRNVPMYLTYSSFIQERKNYVEIPQHIDVNNLKRKCPKEWFR